jgi:hypothetical protein
VRPAFACHCLGDQGFSRSRRTEEEYPFGGFDAQLLEELRMAKRELDRFAKALELIF